MKKLLIFFFLIFSPLHAEDIKPLNFIQLNQLLLDDTLTYKLIKSCVALNSAVTELIKEDYPELANEFFESANYLYPFGILTLVKIKKIEKKDAEKEFYLHVAKQTNSYIEFMKKNGEKNKSFFKGTFLGTDLNYCNEIRAAIKVSISDNNKN